MTTPSPHPLSGPATDATPIFEMFRGCYATELLTAAVAHFGLFQLLSAEPLSERELGARLQLARRPLVVLLTALRAMGLLTTDAQGRVALTELSRNHLVLGGEFYMGAYVGLAAQSPGVLEMVARLRANRSAAAEQPDAAGTQFTYRAGERSAMEEEESARALTLALAGRARIVAPAVAKQAPLAGRKLLVDVGGGSGLYAIACARRFPELRAIVWDRGPVLRVAQEMAEQHGVADRVTSVAGDMFVDPLPPGADCALLSNVLHDWDEPQCAALIQRCAKALPPGGLLIVHDVFLHDALDGPLPLALYSAALFTLTEGRAYSGAEYAAWFRAAGLEPAPIRPTAVHCGLLIGTKR